MTFEAITEIVKRRYETGAYGNAHFRTPAALFDAMRSHVPTPPPPSLYTPPFGYPLGDLMGIPIVVDETLPEHTWRLVDTSTGDVLFSGECTP